MRPALAKLVKRAGDEAGGRKRIIAVSRFTYQKTRGANSRLLADPPVRLAGRWCLDPKEDLSPGQVEDIDRVCASYPALQDNEFVQSNLDRWLN